MPRTQAGKIGWFRERPTSQAVIITVCTDIRVSLIWCPFASPRRYIDLKASFESMAPIPLVREGPATSTDVGMVWPDEIVVCWTRVLAYRPTIPSLAAFEVL